MLFFDFLSGFCNNCENWDKWIKLFDLHNQYTSVLRYTCSYRYSGTLVLIGIFYILTQTTIEINIILPDFIFNIVSPRVTILTFVLIFNSKLLFETVMCITCNLSLLIFCIKIFSMLIFYWITIGFIWLT